MLLEIEAYKKIRIITYMVATKEHYLITDAHQLLSKIFSGKRIEGPYGKLFIQANSLWILS